MQFAESRSPSPSPSPSRVRVLMSRVESESESQCVGLESESYKIRTRVRLESESKDSSPHLCLAMHIIYYTPYRLLGFYRLWSYRSGSACICMLTIHSFTARVSLRMLLIWLPEPWTSLTPWRPGCRQIGFDWTPTKPSSSGWAPATSLENVICRPSAPFCSRTMSGII